MKKIAFYISNHGFGHASRNIPLIRYILEVDKNIRVYVKTGKLQGEFIRESINKENLDRIEINYINVDLGLVLKENSLNIDREKLKKEVLRYLDKWEELSKEEEKFLLEQDIELVISDIVPWILNSTKRLNIKSLLITNFTWCDIYKEYLDKKTVNKFIKAYKNADKVLIYDMEIESIYEYIDTYKKVGLVCREFNEEKVRKIKEKYKKIIFVTVGRSVNLKKELNVNKLDYHFVVTEGINLIGDNVTYLDKSTNNTQDYIKASDFIITKAGWGTIAECLIGKKKFAVIERNEVAEDREVIEKLENKKLALKIKSEFDIESVIQRLERFEKNKKLVFENSYRDIGKEILRGTVKGEEDEKR